MPTDHCVVEAKIFELLSRRQRGSTICPSEVARALAGSEKPWRELMPCIRAVADGLVRHHRLKVTRRGVKVRATDGGGPIRLGYPDDEDLAP